MSAISNSQTLCSILIRINMLLIAICSCSIGEKNALLSHHLFFYHFTIKSVRYCNEISEINIKEHKHQTTFVLLIPFGLDLLWGTRIWEMFCPGLFFTSFSLPKIRSETSLDIFLEDGSMSEQSSLSMAFKSFTLQASDPGNSGKGRAHITMNEMFVVKARNQWEETSLWMLPRWVHHDFLNDKFLMSPSILRISPQRSMTLWS